MRILLANQYFEPEPTMKGLAFVKALSAINGDLVDVVTGVPNYPAGKIYEGYSNDLVQCEQMDGISVTRLPLFPAHGRNALLRIANYLSFFFSLLIWGCARGGRYDTIYVYHPPITVGFAVALFTLIRKRPFVIEIQDLWPESVSASGIAGTGALSRALDAICRFVYRRADRIIAQSHGMAKALEDRGADPERLTVVYNWSNDESEAGEPLTARAGQPFEFLYAGNIGAMQGLDTVIEAARLAHAQDPSIKLALVGDGTEKRRLTEEWSGDEHAFVEFRERVSAVRAAEMAERADCLVLHLRSLPIFEFTIPSKIPFYLAKGRPILAGISGEAATILRDSGAAEVVRPQSAQDFADAMLRIARRGPNELKAASVSGRQYYRQNLSMKQGIAAIYDVLCQTTENLGKN